jgi:hypothetical protein
MCTRGAEKKPFPRALHPHGGLVKALAQGAFLGCTSVQDLRTRARFYFF